KTNANGVPANAVLLSSLMVQTLLVLLYFAGNALDLALDLTSALTLIPFFFAALYAAKITFTRDGYPENTNGLGRERVFAILAVIYTLFLIYAAGLQFLLLSFVIYAPASILFAVARREQG